MHSAVLLPCCSLQRALTSELSAFVAAFSATAAPRFRKPPSFVFSSFACSTTLLFIFDIIAPLAADVAMDDMVVLITLAQQATPRITTHNQKSTALTISFCKKGAKSTGC